MKIFIGSRDLYSLVNGYVYGILLEEGITKSYPVSSKLGVDFYKEKDLIIEGFNEGKKVSVNKEEFENLYKKYIKSEYKFRKRTLLEEKIYYLKKEIKKMNEDYNGYSNFENKYLGALYIHKNKFYKIENIRESKNKEYLTITTELESGKKHVYRMNKRIFMARKYFKMI